MKLGNPNGARALRGKQVGNKQAVAAVKANAEHRAVNLRAIVDDLRSQGFTSVRAIAAQLNERGILTPVVARGTQRQPLGCCRGCKQRAERDGGLSRTVHRYPAWRSRAAMRAATCWASPLNA